LGGGILADGIIASPVFTAPEFSLAAMAELVMPLTITVVIVQNGQGIAVLQAAGHKPGVNVAAAVSGLVSMPMALIGNISTCLTGPTNALIVSGPHKERHYAAAMVTAVGAIAVGLFSPVFVGFMLAMPAAFIAALAGIAMLTPLKNAFIAGFSGAYSTGALVCFLITVSEISLLGISAPFWGIVFGCLIAWLMDARAQKTSVVEDSPAEESTAESTEELQPTKSYVNSSLMVSSAMMQPMPELMPRHTAGRESTCENFAAARPTVGNHSMLAAMAPAAKNHRPVSPYWLASPPIITSTST